ncbi:MAG: hypothetical protein KC518_13220, partial [Candidatus Cloacimonetes bacterium]|nr:hypothetical protein [Candidatus Cloacimonadota bacterium]
RNGEGLIRHTQHYYDDRNQVWLLLDGVTAGRSMAPIASTGGTPVQSVVWRTFIDENINNARNSSRDWFGVEFVNRNTQSWSWPVPLGAGNRSVALEYRFSYSTNPSNTRDSLHFELNGLPVGGRGVRPSSSGTLDADLALSGNALSFSITQLASTGIPVLLDYIELAVESQPAFVDGVCHFESPLVPGPWSTTIGSFPAGGYLLDVTFVDSTRVSRGATFSDRVPENPAVPGSGLQRLYYGVAEAGIRSITGAQLDSQPDLLLAANTTELVVISPESLVDAVQPLVDHRNARGDVRARLVTLEDVYRQFNAGVADPGAVRNFLRAEYQSGLPSPVLKYALLVGNGHYDPVGRIQGAWPDLFPVWYQSGKMIDEYYGWLLNDNSMDIAIGRLSAWSSAEVSSYVDKLIRYESGQDDGAWRNRMIFVGDDEHGENGIVRSWESDHTQHSEYLISAIVPPSFEVERIYEIEYPTVYNPEIRVNEKPLAEKRLLDGMREGASLINYIGHGNNTTWTHEYLFNSSKHFNLLPGNNRPAIYIAATCSWAEIDLPIGLALPQQLLTMPRGGAMGVMAATRNTTSGGNDRFARNLYPALFAAWSDSLTERITVAEAMRIAKNASVSSNDELYLYLGDPSQMPGFPEGGGRLTAVRRPDGSVTDTLRTLELATLEALAGPFSVTSAAAPQEGEALVVVREAPVPRRYYYDLPSSGTATVPDSLDYEKPGALLFAGKVRYTAGRPLARFIMPADFSGRTAPGQVRMYYTGEDASGQLADGLIFDESIHFALNPDPPVDEQAPTLRLSFNGPQWRENDLLAPNSSVYIVLADSNGINLTGEIGHRIELEIDGGTPVDLTPAFVYDNGSWTEGTVQQELPQLEAGLHHARVRAFDNFNNPGYAEAEFRVVNTGSLSLVDLVNYPNPVGSSTRFTFRLNGLAIDPPADVELRVFTTRGRRVFGDRLALTGNESLYYSEDWRPRDDRGDPLARGVYLYQLRLKVPATSWSRVDELGNLVSESVNGGTVTANGSLIVD